MAAARRRSTLLAARVRRIRRGDCTCAAGQRLNGVAAEIQHGLNDVVRIDRERRQARIVVALDGDAFGRLAAQQVIDALQQLVHVDQLLRGRASGPEHGIEQIGEPVRFADDDARVFAQRRIQEFALEQLRGAAQAAERIFDFVRELADHQAAPAQLSQQRVLAGQAPMLRDVFDFQQQPDICPRRA